MPLDFGLGRRFEADDPEPEDPLVLLRHPAGGGRRSGFAEKPLRSRNDMRRRNLALAALLPALALSACGSPAGPTTSDASSTSPSAGESTSPSAGESAPVSAENVSFPMIVDSCGTEITIEKPAERLWSGSYEMTHTLLALGLADQIVGAAPFRDQVPEKYAADADKINTIKDASSESVLDFDPDLLVASWNIFDYGLTNREMFDTLGIPFYMSPTECSGKEQTGDSDAAERSELLDINVFFTEVEQLAAMTGHPERGTELVAQMKDQLATVAEKDFSDVNALIWYANNEDSPTVAGCCGASGIIMNQLGVNNVFEDLKSEWPTVGWEDVADRNPDVIIFGDLDKAEETIEFLNTNPVTKTLDAVVNERYVAVPTAAFVSSVVMVDAVEDIAAALTSFGLGE